MKSWSQNERPLNIGHRGASGHAPENTITAFKEAERLGADGVELDVQLCASGEVVVAHDEDLQRVAGSPARVEKLSLSTLQRFDVGRWFHPRFAGERIPTLQEVLDAIPSLLVNVEIKVDHLLRDFRELCRNVATIVRQQPKGRIVVSSFHPGVLFWYQCIDPETPLGYLHSHEQSAVFRSWWLANRLKPFAMHPGKKLLNAEYVQRARALGRTVNTWTANEPDDIQRAIDDGVDAIIGNYPERISAALDCAR